MQQCLPILSGAAVLPSRRSVPPFSCLAIARSELRFNGAADLHKWNLRAGRSGRFVVNVLSGSASNIAKSDDESKEGKSEEYSQNMSHAMGAVLTYRHEEGLNYNFVLPDLVVGSCLQTPEDVDKLRKLDVKTIFCLQQNSDLEYFGVDICAIQEYVGKFADITHYRAEIRDFDAFDLRMRLPAVVSKFHKAIKQNGGIIYVHCTAGLGRAPATALAYMFWVRGYKLSEALKLLLSVRSCFPNLEAIKNATADILTGLPKGRVTLTWEDPNCTSVEVSGLDIGWGQRLPLIFDKEQNIWILERDMPEGRYEYKYIIDGKWLCNMHEMITVPKSDHGNNVNNYVHVISLDSTMYSRVLRQRMAGEDPYLSIDERQKIREFLEACPDSS